MQSTAGSGMLSVMPKPDRDLDSLTKDELYELATELEIKGRSQLSRQDLLEAVKAAQLEAQKAPESEAPPASADNEATEPEQQLSQDELRKIVAAKTEQLEMILGDQDLPGYLRTAVETEVQQRRDKVLAHQRQAASESEIERWQVIKGGRYVTKEAYVTTLPVGSVVTPYTHDLAHVRQQGIVLERIQGVITTADQLGRPVTEFVS